MDLLFSLCIGVGLAAACGFRVFVPLLVMATAANTGHLELSESFQWIGSPGAIAAFGAATVLEIGGYYVPWIDHLLDTIATPAAVIAGTLATGAMVHDMDPLLKWAVAIIAGGGVAGTVQAGSVVVRGASTMFTGGLGNPVVSTVEAGGSILLAIMAVVVPVLAVAVLFTVMIFGVRKINQIRRRRAAAAAATVEADAARSTLNASATDEPGNADARHVAGPVRILDVKVNRVGA
ncbi:MAG: DUF4126 family protein [Phycisphaera sp.]|nr:DUF4126 family protein [Phycisphaera sp.]